LELFSEFSRGKIDALGDEFFLDFDFEQPLWANASISTYDAKFLAGLISTIRPKKVVEVGVASGWGSLVMMQAMLKSECTGFKYFGVDLFDNFFMDEKYKTGQVITDLAPQFKMNYSLITGKTVGQSQSEIGNSIDFAFIDGHHMHPWATIDLLALLPIMNLNSWVALHDIALSSLVDQKHVNRGPKYLFEGWDSDRLQSIQVPSMIGALKVIDHDKHLQTLLEVLYTPWETTVEWQFLQPILNSIKKYFGSEKESEFRRAFELGNYYVNMMHRPNLLEQSKFSRQGNFMREKIHRFMESRVTKR